MTLFETLRGQHVRIKKVTDALNVFVLDAEAKLVLDPHELIRFLTFVRGYIDGYHYELEETVLLPALEAEGFGALERGPLAHIRDEHRGEGVLVLRLEMAACAQAPWGKEQIAGIVAAARTLTSFELSHMLKERDHLFPAAEKALVGDDADAVQKKLERFERVRAPRWDVPALVKLADELVAAHAPEAKPV